MTLHAGTDAGSVVIFDPASLPDDYDSVGKDDPISVIEHLHQEGKLFWVDAHGDGSYQLGVFEGTNLPEKLTSFVTSDEEITNFHALSGTLYFTGIEYVFRHDSSQLLKYPHMGESIRIRPGVHAATFYSLDYPDDFEDTLIAQHLSPEQLAARKRINTVMPVGCLAVIALILAFFLLPLATWSQCALPVCVAAISFAFWGLRSQAVKSADLAAKKITDDYPDYVLVIHSVPSAASPL